MAAMFTMGTARVAPGTRGTGYIESVVLKEGTPVRIPLVIAQGTEPGPILWVGAAIHGNEIIGCEAIRRVMRREVDPTRLRGTVIAAPVQNPVGYVEALRLTSHDGLNVNRLFPGNREGSVSERLAYDLFHQGAERADVVLDIHANLPGGVNYVIVSENVERTVGEEQWALAKAFGMTTAVASGGSVGLKGTLQDTALSMGKPALIIELTGGSREAEEYSVEAGVRGVLNVLRHHRMIDGPQEKQVGIFVIPEVLRTWDWVRCGRGGLVWRLKDIGDPVERGEPIAAIYDTFGEEVERVPSGIKGWIITFPLKGNRTVVAGEHVAFIYGP